MDTTNTNHNTPRGAQTQTHDDTVSPEEHADTSRFGARKRFDARRP